MTGSTRMLGRVAAVVLVAGGVACANYLEVLVETPLEATLDVSKFQRVLIAGFLAGGTDEVDTNLETARLLRSQMRSNPELRVIDSEVLDLIEIAGREEGITIERENPPPTEDEPGVPGPSEGAGEEDDESLSEEDLELYETIFANVSYWRQLGEEYQNPLIITGTVYFSPQERSGMVTREREVFDSFGRRQVVPVRAYRDRRGFVLSPKFVFIDGETGAQLHTSGFREEILYDSSQNTPALSSYFELMDRLLPSFLGSLSAQSVRGTRILLK
jgi:hypothetical protein